MFLPQTINNILANREADTEILAVLDGEEQPHFSRRDLRQWEESNRVVLLRCKEPIGQRGSVNLAARHSQAKFVMKLDAHSAVDKGFDVKLIADYEPDWTVIPRMYNLKAFEWKCLACGDRTYQGPKPEKCTKCGASQGFEMVILWQARIGERGKCTDFARFDNTLHFQYWSHYGKRPEAKWDIADVMSSVGACFFMSRERFFELEGMDEGHGVWGQFGVEISCKSWLSGGRQVVNKKTWFSHMFRTKQGNGWGFPYHISGNQQDRAREYSRDIWFNNRWAKQQLPLRWIVDKFSPVPGWENFNWNGR
jgi:hypothetical protein